MKTTRLFMSVVSTALVALGVRAAAEVTLPNGPNRDLVARTCGSCHDLGLVVDAGGRSREGWNAMIDNMTSYGLSVTLAERALILEYLATFLPVRQ